MTEKEAAAIRRRVDEQAHPLSVALLLWLWLHPDKSRTDGSKHGATW